MSSSPNVHVKRVSRKSCERESVGAGVVLGVGAKGGGGSTIGCPTTTGVSVVVVVVVLVPVPVVVAPLTGGGVGAPVVTVLVVAWAPAIVEKASKGTRVLKKIVVGEWPNLREAVRPRCGAEDEIRPLPVFVAGRASMGRVFRVWLELR